MRRLAFGILVAIGATAAVATWSGQPDEVPIIVRDGSIVITTAGTFEGVAGNAYKHQADGTHMNAFWVKVVMSGTTPAQCQNPPRGARQVAINYSANAFGASFGVDPNGKGTGRPATTITPRNGTFTRSAPGRLEYPAKPDKGRIQSVAIGTWSCEIPAGQLREIRVCSAATRQECR